MGPEDFDYVLPADRIAQEPAARRAAARMFVVGAQPPHATVSELPARLPADALVVVNASRVVPARVQATRGDGRAFELLLGAPREDRVSAWVRGAKRLRVGDLLAVGDLRLRYAGPDEVDPRARRFEVEAGAVLPTLAAEGEVPLPPYIARPVRPEDRTRYQTIYAETEGSVAAPTAGLHFDRELVDALDVVAITLHVGPGTFLPMEAADVRDHRVGREHFEIDEAAAQRIKAAREQGRPIVAVGTTVTRALETVGHDIRPIVSSTDLVITPGFDFEVVTQLLTNFHLPRSSLLMLVCAFGGRERILDAYAQAIAQGYRFYSYGDAMLVSRA
jgi:S-adenosylmethionine:tRNA ribosyltransferase-isomerase